MIKLRNSKKAEGAIEMSFGTIFSVILMIIFVAVAFIAIKYFFGIQSCAKVGIFWDDFQNEVDSTWNTQGGEFLFKGTVPNGVKNICFADLSKPINGAYESIGDEISIYEGEKANTFVYPIEEACEMPYKTTNHLDMADITADENPYCIKVSGGMVSIKIKREFNQKLVTVSRP